MLKRITSLIFGPGPTTPDVHTESSPKPPTFRASDFFEAPKSVPPEGVESGNVRNVPRKKSVRIFGVDMASVHQDLFTETWDASFGLIYVRIKFDARNTPQPWIAQVIGLYQSITSHPFDDVLRLEKWVEKTLLRTREQIPAGPPHMIAEQRRREALRSKVWQPLPREPLEFECFAVKADDGEYCIIQKAPFPRGEHRWMTKLSKVTAVWTWDVILSKFSHYCELPPV